MQKTIHLLKRYSPELLHRQQLISMQVNCMSTTAEYRRKNLPHFYSDIVPRKRWRKTKEAKQLYKEYQELEKQQEMTGKFGQREKTRKYEDMLQNKSWPHFDDHEFFEEFKVIVPLHEQPQEKQDEVMALVRKRLQPKKFSEIELVDEISKYEISDDIATKEVCEDAKIMLANNPHLSHQDRTEFMDILVDSLKEVEKNEYSLFINDILQNASENSDDEDDE